FAHGHRAYADRHLLTVPPGTRDPDALPWSRDHGFERNSCYANRMMFPVAERLAATSRIYYGWILVFALGAMSVVVIGTASTLFGIVLVPIQHELGWSRGEISGAYSLSYLVWGLAGIPAGQFIDRHGARNVMAVGAL